MNLVPERANVTPEAKFPVAGLTQTDPPYVPLGRETSAATKPKALRVPNPKVVEVNPATD